MSENKQPTPQNEEVDLGQLFKMIGNAFQKLFDFIASIFKGLFSLLLVLVTHFYIKAKWYAIAGVLGLVAGYFLNKTSQKQYAANMFIETNFNSSRQAYEVMKEFHQLAAVDKDTIELAKRLNISPTQASNLKGFYIEADRDETVLLKDFLNYKSELDSLSQLETNFEDFKREQSDHQFKEHKIGVIATDKFIFKRINEGMISEFLDNDYINNVRITTLKNLDKQEVDINTELKSLVSLLETYTEIRKKASEKEFTPGEGTNFYMGNAEKTDLIKDETLVLQKMAELEGQKRRIALERVKNEKQINVISNFPDTGYDLTVWYENKIILVPVAFLALLLLFFSFKGLGKYIKAQDAQ